MGLAGVFRDFRNRIEIADTIEERDVDIYHGIFAPAMRGNSNGYPLGAG